MRSAGLGVSLGVYSGTAIGAFKATIKYPFNHVLGGLALAAETLLLCSIWQYLYANRDFPEGHGLNQQLIYTVVSLGQFHTLNAWSCFSLPDRVQSGLVATDMCRPGGVVRQAVASYFGSVLAVFIPSLVVITAFLLFYPTRVPDAWQVALFVVAQGAAVGIACLLVTTVSLLAFRTTEVTGFLMIYAFVAQFASGALIPLWLMPDELRLLLSVLPFQAMTYVPGAILAGYMPSNEALLHLMGQVVWVAVLSLVLKASWVVIRRGLLVHGG